ncbi:MAG: hypothetical protein WEK74_12280, partial [Hydrogenophaga sp.]
GYQWWQLEFLKEGDSTEIVHWGWAGWRTDAVASQFVPTEAMACTMSAEEGQKWPQRRRQYPKSTEGASNGQPRLKANLTGRPHCLA